MALNLEKYVSELKLIHSFITIGSIVVLGVISFILKPFSQSHFDLSFGTYTMIGLGLGFLAIIAAYLVFQKKLDRLGSQHIDENTITEMRASYITKWALLEGAALINMILYFLEGNKLLICFALMLIVLLYLSRPRLSVTYQ